MEDGQRGVPFPYPPSGVVSTTSGNRNRDKQPNAPAYYPITTPLLPHYYPRGSKHKPNNIIGLDPHYYTTTPFRYISRTRTRPRRRTLAQVRAYVFVGSLG